MVVPYNPQATYRIVMGGERPAPPPRDLEVELFAAVPTAFWLDPTRWDGITDPHRVWMRSNGDALPLQYAALTRDG